MSWQVQDDAGQQAREHPDQTRKGGQFVEKDLGIGQPGQAEQGQPAQELRSLIPPMTPRVIFRALLGVLLFFCGIVLGAWLMIRFRRQLEDTMH